MGVSMRTREARGIVWSRYGFENLLVWLFIYLMIGPFLESFPYAHVLMNVFLTAVLSSAVCALNRSSKMLPVSRCDSSTVLSEGVLKVKIAFTYINRRIAK
jgi:hypothetical protein